MSAIPQHPALWRGDRLALPALPGVATGYAALDAVLPGGGWPVDGLSEIFPARPGIGELSLLTPALARLSRDDSRWQVWIAPPHIPYAPALAAAGIDLRRIIVVRPGSPKESLWAAQQALTSQCSSAVLAWLANPQPADLRRLQLAAAGAGCPAFLFRPARAAATASPAILRLRLEAAERRRLAVQVLKRRGGPLGHALHLNLGEADHVLDRHPPAQAAPAGLPARHSLA